MKEIPNAAHSIVSDRCCETCDLVPRLVLDPYYQMKQAALMLATELMEMTEALNIAERFMSGFEGDDIQRGIDEKLTIIRAAMAKKDWK